MNEPGRDNLDWKAIKKILDEEESLYYEWINISSLLTKFYTGYYKIEFLDKIYGSDSASDDPAQQKEAIESTFQVASFRQLSELVFSQKYFEGLIAYTTDLVKTNIIDDPISRNCYYSATLSLYINRIIWLYSSKTVDFADQKSLDRISLLIFELVLDCKKSGFRKGILSLGGIFSEITKNIRPASAGIILDKIKDIEVRAQFSNQMYLLEKIIPISLEITAAEEEAIKAFVRCDQTPSCEDLSTKEKAKRFAIARILIHLYPNDKLETLNSEYSKIEVELEAIKNIFEQCLPVCRLDHGIYEDFVFCRDIFRLHLQSKDHAATTEYCNEILETFGNLTNNSFVKKIQSFCQDHKLNDEALLFCLEDPEMEKCSRLIIPPSTKITVGFMQLYLHDVPGAMAIFSDLDGTNAAAASPDQSNIFNHQHHHNHDNLFDKDILFAQVGVICCYLQLNQKLEAIELMSALAIKIEKLNKASVYSGALTTLNQCVNHLIFEEINSKQAKNQLIKDIVDFDFEEG